MFPFPGTSTPSHNTTSASALLNDYYYSKSDFIWVYGLDSRTAKFGTDDAETILGTPDADAMDGNVADPETDGGDVLVGYYGDDVYFVSDDHTRIVEETGAGEDLVVTNVDFDLDNHQNYNGGPSEVEAVEVWGQGQTVDASSADWDMMFMVKRGTDHTMIGGSEDDDFYGSEGVDTFTGNAGRDSFQTYGGDDVIDAGAGDDYVRAGAGSDTITGGAGADEFRFDSREGAQADVITDFESGVDHCIVGEVDMFALTFTDTAEGTLMTYAEGCSILFEGLERGDMNLNDFTFYYDDAGTL